MIDRRHIFDLLISYLYAINKISLYEQCVCFITCLKRTHVYFFQIRVSTLNVFKQVMNSTCLRLNCVKYLTAFYVLSKRFRP